MDGKLQRSGKASSFISDFIKREDGVELNLTVRKLPRRVAKSPQNLSRRPLSLKQKKGLTGPQLFPRSVEGSHIEEGILC